MDLEKLAQSGLIATRQIPVRASTIDKKELTVDAVLTTSAPTGVFDWRSWSVIREVLVIDGIQINGGGDQVPMLDSHNRNSNDDLLGSIRNIRPADDLAIGTLHFAKGDDKAERTFLKIVQGHLTDVSVGYEV